MKSAQPAFSDGLAIMLQARVSRSSVPAIVAAGDKHKQGASLVSMVSVFPISFRLTFRSPSGTPTPECPSFGCLSHVFCPSVAAVLARSLFGGGAAPQPLKTPPRYVNRLPPSLIYATVSSHSLLSISQLHLRICPIRFESTNASSAPSIHHCQLGS